MISGFLIPISCILLFWLPVLDHVFFISYLLYFVAFSLYITSYFALLFTKFRNPKERIIIATITTLLSTISSIIIRFTRPSSFLDTEGSSITIALFFIISLLIGILGLREEEELINTYFSPNHAPKERVLKAFFQKFIIFRKKNFLILLFRWIVISIFNSFFLVFLGLYTMDGLEIMYTHIYIDFFYLVYYGCSIIAILYIFLPSWFIGHLIAYRISGFALGIALVAFFFFPDSLLMAIIFMGIIGFTYGLETASLIPVIGDVFDEQAANSRKHSEGFYYGIITAFATMGPLIAPIMMIFVFSLWELPFLMGIKTLMALIPGILIIIVMILFTVFYDLKPHKTEEIRMKLKELQL